MEIKKRILMLRMYIWIHSYLYYIRNQSVIDDYTWSQKAKELVDLQHKHPRIAKSVPLYGIFKDFDGSTGMDFPFDLLWLQNEADKVLDGTTEYTFLKGA